jgi:HK97 gp10 family phage protein
MASLTTSGFKELDKKLGELSKSTGTRVLQRAGMKAMEPMRKRAEFLAPDDIKTPAPDLHRSIVISKTANIGKAREMDVARGRATVFVGPADDVDRWARVMVAEFGSKKMAAKPYMRPAFHQTGRAVLDSLGPLIWAEIAPVLARAAKRAAKGG